MRLAAFKLPKNGFYVAGGRVVDRPDGGLAEERSIEWLRRKDDYRYVREITWESPQYSGCPDSELRSRIEGFNHLVAFADMGTLPEQANGAGHPAQCRFTRRAWYVRDHDDFPGNPHTLCRYKDGGPAEAVIPDSIQVGKPSQAGWKAPQMAPSMEI